MARRKQPVRVGKPLSLFQRFGLFFYDRRETTLLFWVAIVIFGSLSYGTFLKRQGFPAVNVPVSLATGTYFVNDANKIDSQVTEPIAKELSTMPDVKQVNATAGSNFFTFIIEYKEGVTADQGSAEVAAKITERKLLPANASIDYKPANAAGFEDGSDLLVSLYSTTPTTTAALQVHGQQAAEQLAKQKGIASAKLFDPFSTGVNPATGQEQTEQRRFDRVGLPADGQISFYPSVVIGIKAAKGSDDIAIYEDVKTAITKIQSGSSKLVITEDYAESIHSQIDSLQHNLLEGLAVVILVGFLLISWRASIVLALAMGTVLLATISVLYITGNTLNTITLFALILSLGLIVDDTTIMVEAIDANKRVSTSRREILVQSMGRVARASTSGTLVTILAFAPMLFISGILGSFIRVLPITIIISLAVSLLVSLLLVPLLSRYIVLGRTPKTTQRNPILWLESAISNALANSIRKVSRRHKASLIRPVIAVLFSLIVIMASGAFFSKLKFDIFPVTKDGDTISVALHFADGTTITQAEDRTDAANRVIGQALGSNLRRLSYDSTGSTTDALATIMLTPYQQRDIKSPQLVAHLTDQFKAFDGATVKVSQVDAGPPKDDYPFKVQLVGSDRVALRKAAEAVAASLQGRQVTRANGTTARINRVQIDPADRPLRLGAQPVIEVRAGFDAEDTSALLSVTKRAVQDDFPTAKLQQYGLKADDLQFDFGFESDNNDSFKSMLIAFPILLIAMYVLMVVQFRSLLQPLLIFAAIPYSFFGVGLGLYLTDNPLSFFVMVGFFALIGIAINNTILLTDYANQAQDQGLGRSEAAAAAVKARFRPLITTSLTSVVALLPLALTDPFWESLSYTLIFGLISSTALVIISFPYAYLGAEWLRELGRRLWWRFRPGKAA